MTEETSEGNDWNINHPNTIEEVKVKENSDIRQQHSGETGFDLDLDTVYKKTYEAFGKSVRGLVLMLNLCGCRWIIKSPDLDPETTSYYFYQGKFFRALFFVTNSWPWAFWMSFYVTFNMVRVITSLVIQLQGPVNNIKFSMSMVTLIILLKAFAWLVVWNYFAGWKGYLSDAFDPEKTGYNEGKEHKIAIATLVGRISKMINSSYQGILPQCLDVSRYAARNAMIVTTLVMTTTVVTQILSGVVLIYTGALTKEQYVTLQCDPLDLPLDFGNLFAVNMVITNVWAIFLDAAIVSFVSAMVSHNDEFVRMYNQNIKDAIKSSYKFTRDDLIHFRHCYVGSNQQIRVLDQLLNKLMLAAIFIQTPVCCFTIYKTLMSLKSIETLAIAMLNIALGIGAAYTIGYLLWKLASCNEVLKYELYEQFAQIQLATQDSESSSQLSLLLKVLRDLQLGFTIGDIYLIDKTVIVSIFIAILSYTIIIFQAAPAG